MINVKDTIYSTIKDRIDKLRFLAVNDAKVFKKILYLIIMDDIYDWSTYLGESQELQNTIQKLKYDFIRHNEEFLIEREIEPFMYVNVNTPQTNNTWKRVWDDPNVVLLDDTYISPVTNVQTFVPDPNCEIGMVFFPDAELFGGISVGDKGQPVVNLNNLTTCDKMNIFVNRTTGKMYFLDESCNWRPVVQQLMSKITLDDLAFTIPQGLKGEYVGTSDDTGNVYNTMFNIGLSEEPGKAEVQLADSNLIDEVL